MPHSLTATILPLQLDMEKRQNSEHVYRFVAALQKPYGRKPKPEDAVGDFVVQVAQDMRMAVGGARYYLRWATEHGVEQT